MTIGFGMQQPVLNEPRHPWYQKRNHVRIPKLAESKKWLDAAYVGGGAGAPAVGFPLYLFPSVTTVMFDPSNPANQAISGTPGAPVYDGPVGMVKGQVANGSVGDMVQATAANRPLLKRQLGRDCLLFDGVNDILSANIAGAGVDYTTPPVALTMFASVFLHFDVSGQCGLSFDSSTRSNTNNRHLLTVSASGCRAGLRLNAAAFASNIIWLNPAMKNMWIDLFWEVNITAIRIAGVGTGTGTIRSWVNDNPMISTSIVPDRGSAAGSAVFDRFSLGGSLNLLAAQEWCNVHVGKSGFVKRVLTTDERAAIRAWMNSPSYVPPVMTAPTEAVPDWELFDDVFELQAVINHWVVSHGVVLPGNWSALTFAERIQWAKDNIG